MPRSPAITGGLARAYNALAHARDSSEAARPAGIHAGLQSVQTTEHPAETQEQTRWREDESETKTQRPREKENDAIQTEGRRPGAGRPALGPGQDFPKSDKKSACARSVQKLLRNLPV